MRYSLLIFFGSLLTLPVFSQVTEKASETGSIGLLYEKELSFGFRLNTNGWGIFGTYGKAHSYSKSKFYQFEILEVKHPKEEKRSNDFARTKNYTPKPFIFGKQNNMYILHAGYGEKIFLGDKAEKSGVEVNLTWMVGPSLGILKPYYLDVLQRTEATPTGLNLYYTTEKYDPDSDNTKFLQQESILGSSGFGKGLDELSFLPGLHGKAGINFDWANFNESVKAIEVGMAVDIFPKNVPLMAIADNDPYLIYLYLSIQFGKKW